MIQQETELKKLREGQEIRNKRISHLELQVGEAAKHIADRRSPPSNSPSLSSAPMLEVTLQLILSKLERNHCSPVIINNTQNGIASKPLLINQMSQTDLVRSDCSTSQQYSEPNLEHHLNPNHEQSLANESTAFSCGVCKKNLTSHDDLAAHIANQHRTSPSSCHFQCDNCELNFQSDTALSEHLASSHEPSATTPKEFTFTCDNCGRKFASMPQLTEHTESEHADYFLTCAFCAYKCSTETHMSDHIEALHSGDECLNPSKSTSAASNQL